MIADQESFKLKRGVLKSGDIKLIRQFCQEFAPHLLKLNDTELLKLAANSPNWD